MLERFRMDLHVHTCLSPCGELEMLPNRIVKRAKLEGLDVIGICDHNSAENVVAVKRVGKKENLEVVGGMEVTSREEVHILTFFDNEEDLFEFQRIVYDNLDGVNDSELFGEQVVVDEEDNIVSVNDRLLIGATRLSIEKIVDTTHSLGGLAIASHVDREQFGIIGQLGFIPDALDLDGVEISPKMSLKKARLQFSKTLKLPMVTFSDAHILEDIGKSSTCFLMEEVNIRELKSALIAENGRKIIIK